MEQTLRGIGVSPGIAIGPAFLFDARRMDVPRYAIDNPEAELARVDRAFQSTREDLVRLHRHTTAQLGKVHADIFNAHIMLLDDVAIREELAERINSESLNAEHILHELVQRYARVLGEAEDPRFRERTADLLDVAGHVLHHLLDAKRPNLRELAEASIIVAHDLSPSDTASMNTEKALGLAMDAGSATSHTAILARALEIPAVVGLKLATGAIESGVTMVVDGSEGQVIVDPTPETLARYQVARELVERKRQALQRFLTGSSCRTLDGVEVPLMSNIELPVEIPHTMKSGVQGIGLYRTEYLFLNRDTLPSEEEQYQSYAEVARALNPRPVTLRTIDIGGDKFVSHLQISKEENPQLGWRAVRFCLQRPDIFKTQLRAMLRASAHGNVQIMFPMISGLEELRQVKAVLWEVRDELKRQRIPMGRNIKVGSMIEVPSAVTLTDVLAKECDFFSIGTNDLIQYSLAVDRVNEKIAHLYEPAHPAIMRMIRWTANAARTENIPCSICGEMAGDPLFTEVLIGLGVTALSMSPVALPLVRAEITQSYMQEAEALARRVLRLSTAVEVRALLQERYERKAAMETYLAKFSAETREERS